MFRDLFADRLALVVVGCSGVVWEWHYGDQCYEIRSEGEKLFFHQEGVSWSLGGLLHGQLLVDGEWHVATVKDESEKEVGMIRLKQEESQLKSNFKRQGEEAWGKDIWAKKGKKVCIRCRVGLQLHKCWSNQYSCVI